MPDDHEPRTASHAKSVDGLVQQESALDRARSLKEQFNRAQSPQEHQQQTEQSKGGAQQGSKMVKEDAPALRPTPTGPMRDGPDQTASAAKLKKEHSIEDQKLQQAEKAREAFKSRQGTSHEQERDHER